MATPTRTPAPRARRDTPAPLDPLIDAGDGLLRAAQEVFHQRERVSRLQSLGASDAELKEAAAICALTDKHLTASAARYEAAAAENKGGRTPDDQRRAASTLWHAAREYARRHRSCDDMTTKLAKHSSEHLGALAMEYELEASALLALTQGISAYLKLRPQSS